MGREEYSNIERDLLTLVETQPVSTVGASGMLLGGGANILGGYSSMDEALMSKSKLPPLGFKLAHDGKNVRAVFVPSLNDYIDRLGNKRVAELITKLREKMAGINMEEDGPLIFKKKPDKNLLNSKLEELFKTVKSKPGKSTVSTIKRGYYLYYGRDKVSDEVSSFRLEANGRPLFVIKVDGSFQGVVEIAVENGKGGPVMNYKDQSDNTTKPMPIDRMELALRELEDILDVIFN